MSRMSERRNATVLTWCNIRFFPTISLCLYLILVSLATSSVLMMSSSPVAEAARPFRSSSPLRGGVAPNGTDDGKINRIGNWEWLPSLPVPLQLSGTAHVGRYVALLGGCTNSNCSKFSDDIIMFDSVLALEFQYPVISWYSTKKNVAKLEIPVAGIHSSVAIGNSVFVVGMCTIVPWQENQEKLRNVTRNLSPSFQRVQRIDLINTQSRGIGLVPQDVQAPPIVAVNGSFANLDPQLVSLRFNASCVAFGGLIYVIGGMHLDFSFASSVGTFDPSTGKFSDEEFTYPQPVTNPGVTSDSNVLYVVGGVLNESNYPPASDRLYTLFAGSSNFHHQTSYASQPQFMYPPLIRARVLGGSVLITAEPFSVIEVWNFRFHLAWGWQIGNPNPIHTEDSTFYATPSTEDGLYNLTLLGGQDDGSGLLQENNYRASLGIGLPFPRVAGVINQTIIDEENTKGGSNASHQKNHSTPTAFFRNQSVFQFSPTSYAVLPYNESFYILFPETVVNASGVAVQVFANCQPSSLLSEANCRVRLSSSASCSDQTEIAALSIGPGITRKIRLNETGGGENSNSFYMLGPFFVDIPSGFLDTVPSDAAPGSFFYQWPRYDFVYVCYSEGLYRFPSCDNLGGCYAPFFIPINELYPYQLALTLRHGGGKATSAPSSGPTQPPSSHTPLGLSTSKIIIIASVAGVLLIFAIWGLVRCCCCDDEENDEEGGDDGGWTGRLLNSIGIRGPPKNHKKHNDSSSSKSNKGWKGGELLNGEYKIKDKLGKGSFSVVYLVESVTTKSTYALKYIQVEDEAAREDAMKECEVVRKLQAHPHVIRLVDMFLSFKFDVLFANSPSGSSGKYSPKNSTVGSHSPAIQYNDGVIVENSQQKFDGEAEGTAQQGQRYLSLVMEYHAKGDLGRWVRRQKIDHHLIPEGTIVSIAHQMCSVLHFMHTKKPPIIHRDLKPENILLSSVIFENVAPSFVPIVLTDFGLSRVMDKAFCETGVGSLPYVAPECWRRCYTTKVDIWAVGCILFAVISRRVEADNVVVMFSESSRPDFQVFLKNAIVNYGYSEQLAHFISRLLEPDPEQRPTAFQCMSCIKRRDMAMQLCDTSTRSSAGKDTVFSTTLDETQHLLGTNRMQVVGGNTQHHNAVFEYFLIEMDAQNRVMLEEEGGGKSEKEGGEESLPTTSPSVFMKKSAAVPLAPAPTIPQQPRGKVTRVLRPPQHQTDEHHQDPNSVGLVLNHDNVLPMASSSSTSSSTVNNTRDIGGLEHHFSSEYSMKEINSAVAHEPPLESQEEREAGGEKRNEEQEQKKYNNAENDVHSTTNEGRTATTTTTTNNDNRNKGKGKRGSKIVKVTPESGPIPIFTDEDAIAKHGIMELPCGGPAHTIIPPTSTQQQGGEKDKEKDEDEDENEGLLREHSSAVSSHGSKNLNFSFEKKSSETE